MYLENSLAYNSQKPCGSIEVICGSMFSGKTEELIRRINRVKIARRNIRIFKPTIDYRYSASDIVSHNQSSTEAIPVMSSLVLFNSIPEDVEVVAIDEAQFFDNELVKVVQNLAKAGKRVIIAGLDMDYLGQPFGPMPELMAIADEADKWDAVVIIRGGGASIDMNCFDSYLLAATCAQFPLPIITGIGHTRDVSILDLVAYKALKTPTAVAAFFVDRLKDEQQRLSDWRRRLQETAKRQVILRQHVIELLRQRLLACDPERIYRQGYALVTKEGQPVTSIKQTKAGQSLVLHLMDGEVKVTVS